jgi:hypothetical protein
MLGIYLWDGNKMKNIVDDIFSFDLYSQYSNGPYYEKNIGDYILSIFIGKWEYTCSKPEDNTLPINKYRVVGVVVSENSANFILDLLETFSIQGLPEIISNTKGYYNLSIQELNLVYNHLINLAEGKDNTEASSVKNKEKACKVCGRMNDE